VEFDTEGMISLAIPEDDGINSQGWTITPTNTPCGKIIRTQSIAMDSLPPMTH